MLQRRFWRPYYPVSSLSIWLPYTCSPLRGSRANSEQSYGSLSHFRIIFFARVTGMMTEVRYPAII
jgi:hypothetical protein